MKTIVSAPLRCYTCIVLAEKFWGDILMTISRTVAAAFFSFLLLPYAGALADDSSCAKFDSLFSKNPRYLTVSAINGEGKGMGFGATSFYTDANNEKLYALASVNTGKERYEAGIQIYPEISVQVIALGAKGEKKFPKEIQDFVAPLKWQRMEKWKGDNSFTQIVPAPHDQCNPLVGTIPGDQFEDGKPRLFLHHFLLGRRGMAPRLGCESWGTRPEQFLFYAAFTPQVFPLKSGPVYVDPGFAGIDKNGQFEYPCGIKGFIQAREKVLDKEPGKPVDTQQYLAEKGLISPDESKNFYAHPEHVWELQVLRNLTEGRELFDH
jgi:hypothetical protein